MQDPMAYKMNERKKKAKNGAKPSSIAVAMDCPLPADRAVAAITATAAVMTKSSRNEIRGNMRL
jgi:hypothetical protein